MSTVFAEVNYNASGLIESIDTGSIGLPDIQRPFVWKASQVRDLFDSMYRGFPVGYFLFWKTDTPGKKQIGTDGKQVVPDLLIVDGQQRLTSLYAVMKGKEVVTDDFSTRLIEIAFRPRDETFEVADAASRRDPEFIPNISVLWDAQTPTYGFITKFLERLEAHRLEKGEDFGADEKDHIASAISRLAALKAYPFTALQISQSVTVDEVSDIFVRINSKGVSLKQSDFILTLMSVYWDEGRTALETFSRESKVPAKHASPYNPFIHPDPDQILRVAVAFAFRRARLEHVYSLLRGKDLETKQFSDELRQEQFNRLAEAQEKTLDLTSWHEFLKALKSAGFTGGWMISSETGILYSYAFYLIGKHDYGMGVGELRDVIARWFFMTALAARYSTSPETRMEQDLARLRGVDTKEQFVAVLDRVVRDTLTEDFWSITTPNWLDSSASRSPALFGYYAALNLLEARVLFSQMKVADLLDPVMKAKKTSLERHHLFPRNHLQKLGYAGTKQINQIANYALVEWFDNIEISDDDPADYFPLFWDRAKARRGLSDIELQRMRHWHALPENWEVMEYDVFLEERRRRMASVMREGFEALCRKTGLSLGEERVDIPATG